MIERDLTFPPLSLQSTPPVWVGGGFEVEGKKLQILDYNSNMDGWNDELTSFHEESVGDDHFMDWGSRKHALSEIKQHTSNLRDPVILEVGCSSGYLLEKMRQELPHAQLIGSDVILSSMGQLANKMPDVGFLRFDLTKCPLKDNFADVVVSLNVLEHIEDDQLAIKNIFRILKPGGIAVIEVPAGEHLFDIYDKALMHYRRYEMQDLIQKFQVEGFNILKKSHLGFFVYPGFYFVKKRNRRIFPQLEDKNLQKEIVQKNIRKSNGSSIMRLPIWMELKLGQMFSFPFGIRCLVTCQKPLS